MSTNFETRFNPINAWRDQPPTNYTAQTYLCPSTTDNAYFIEAWYYEHGGGAAAQFTWYPDYP